jgi:glycosyltransferase involved in cell wall biosynthesis
MKLLMITAQAPYPPNSGARIRVWEELRYLSRRHDLTAVFFREPGTEDSHSLSPLDGLCRRTVPVPHPQQMTPDDLALSRGAPWPLRWYGAVDMYRALQDVRPWRFDAVIVDQLYMTLYRELFPGRTILQEHNIESHLARQFMQPPRADAPPEQRPRRIVWRAAAVQMEAYENRTWPKFPLRVTVSESDKAEIDQRCAVGRTIVVENGADVTAPVVRDDLGARTILFMGALDYFPNVDAAFHLVNTIMPAVWARGPDIRLIIAGRHPDPSLSSLLGDPRVQMVANPEDMRTVAARASVSTVPLRNGAGTRVKILESLAWGLPVISTQLGCANLALTDGEGLVIRDDPEAFAEAVVRSLTDAGLWRRLSSAGRACVEQRYGWEPLLERFEAELYRFVDGPVPTHASPPRPE